MVQPYEEGLTINGIRLTLEDHLQALLHGIIPAPKNNRASITIVVSLSVISTVSNRNNTLKLLTSDALQPIVAMSHQDLPCMFVFSSNKAISNDLWRGFYQLLIKESFNIIKLKGLWGGGPQSTLCRECIHIFPATYRDTYRFTLLKYSQVLVDLTCRAGETSALMLIDTKGTDSNSQTVPPPPFDQQKAWPDGFCLMLPSHGLSRNYVNRSEIFQWVEHVAAAFQTQTSSMTFPALTLADPVISTLGDRFDTAKSTLLSVIANQPLPPKPVDNGNFQTATGPVVGRMSVSLTQSLRPPGPLESSLIFSDFYRTIGASPNAHYHPVIPTVTELSVSPDSDDELPLPVTMSLVEFMYSRKRHPIMDGSRTITHRLPSPTQHRSVDGPHIPTFPINAPIPTSEPGRCFCIHPHCFRTAYSEECSGVHVQNLCCSKFCLQECSRDGYLRDHGNTPDYALINERMRLTAIYLISEEPDIITLWDIPSVTNAPTPPSTSHQVHVTLPAGVTVNQEPTNLKEPSDAPTIEQPSSTLASSSLANLSSISTLHMHQRINYLSQRNFCKTTFTYHACRGFHNPATTEWTASIITDFQGTGGDLSAFDLDPWTSMIEVNPQETFTTKVAARDNALRTMFERYPRLLGRDLYQRAQRLAQPQAVIHGRD